LYRSHHRAASDARDASSRDSPPAIDALPSGALKRLAEAISIATISYDDRDAIDPEAFSAFHAMLERSFPRLHATLSREVVANHSLLYHWRGSDPSLRPVLLMSHIDVVPIEAGTEEDWTHPPFGGVLADGYIWGRGTIDTKSTLMGSMEAIEGLLARGVRPRRGVYLAFGHDEEVGGAQGGAAIVALLQRRGVRFAYVLDEGGAVVPGEMFGIAPSVAAVGTAEKGMVNIELSARGDQGHASMPRPADATRRVCRAVTKVHAAPYPLRVTATMASLLEQLADHMPWPRRMLLKNLWLFAPWVMRELARDPAMAAAMHTTQATTMLEGSSKANTLASRARAVVNVRLLEGDSTARVVARLRRVIDDPDIELRVMEELGHSEPVPPSSIDSLAFEAIRQTLTELFPDAIIVPHTVAGATDSRQFAPLCSNIYRFAPMRLETDDLCRIHGTDERLSIDNYRTMVAFFRALLLRSVR
jgi:carboxypeptidase PM20D1